MSDTWVTVARTSTVEPGNVVGVKAGDVELAIYNLDGVFYATDDVCTHAYALLSKGWVDGDVIECPLHGGRFEIRTGKGLGAPIMCDIRTYPVRVVGEEIQVDLGGAP